MEACRGLVFSLTLYFLRRPILVPLGASPATYAYTETYLFLVVTLGTLPTVLSGTLAQLFRSVGFAKKASFGLSLGAILNIILDPLFMFVLLPQGEELTGAALATLLSNPDFPRLLSLISRKNCKEKLSCLYLS